MTPEEIDRIANKRADQAKWGSLPVAGGVLASLPCVLPGLWRALLAVPQVFHDLLPDGEGAALAIRAVAAFVLVNLMIGASTRLGWGRSALLLYLVGGISYLGSHYESAMPWLYLLGMAALVGGWIALHWSAQSWKLLRRAELARRDSRPPFLLLRSFRHDRLLFRPQSDGGGRGMQYLAELAQAVSPLGRPLMIGRPRNMEEDRSYPEVLFLPSRDDDWGLLFSATARAAGAIIFIPETTEGLVREILRVLDSELLDKALVVVPWAAGAPAQDTLRKRWRVVQEAWGKGGFRLPDYPEKGMIFQPNKDLSVRASWEVGPEGSGPAITAAIEALSRSGDSQRYPLSNLVELIDLKYERGMLRIPRGAALLARVRHFAEELAPAPIPTEELRMSSAQALAHAVIAKQISDMPGVQEGMMDGLVSNMLLGGALQREHDGLARTIAAASVAPEASAPPASAMGELGRGGSDTGGDGDHPQVL